MALINECIVKEQILNTVERLIRNYASDEVADTMLFEEMFPLVIEDLAKELDKILTNGKT